MIIIKLMGGLGNQMFQYALGKSLSARLDDPFKLDLEFLLDRTPKENFVFRDYDLDIFQLKAERATKNEMAKFIKLQKPPKDIFDRVFRKIQYEISPRKYFFEPHFHYTPTVFTLPKNSYLEGYWQSPKYFEGIEDELRKDFTFKEVFSLEVRELAQEILSTNSVCVNVRRTDFLNTGFHGVCDMKYFKPSMDFMTSRIGNPHFFIFSDDPQWCVENFKSGSQITIVGHEYKGHKFAAYLHLMSLCKHYIIPNSTFAWWAAWLNKEKDKIVIAPKIWIADQKWDSKDLIPENWIRMEN